MAAETTRVAILGGGVGAMTAAFALSEINERFGNRFDITVYQLGWRLGGKTASGRNAAEGQRIEEHGLHVWAGFYDNAFTVMRAALKALNRPAGTPLATIGDCFRRQNQVFLTDQDTTGYQPWPFWCQPDSDPDIFPGVDSLWDQDSTGVSPGTVVRRAIAALVAYFEYYRRQDQALAALTAAADAALAGLPAELKAKAPLLRTDAHPLLDLLSHLAGEVEHDLEIIRDGARLGLLAALDALRAGLRALFGPGGIETQLGRAFVMLDLGLVIVRGILRDGFGKEGLRALDRWDFREFLKNNDILKTDCEGPYSIGGNAIVRALYDYTFAYQSGLRAQPRLSACSAVQGCLRMVLTYKGAFFWKATAGFGDTIFTPLYELLRQRGVTFRFFQRVTRLVPEESGTAIAAIELDEQAQLKDPASGYEPLVTIPAQNGIGCWPSEPDWKQLVDGDALRAAGVSFEDPYGPQPPNMRCRRLKRGEDFDEVVLGIPVAALSDICAPLITRDDRWKRMVENLGTVRTQALQLWTTRGLDALGGPYVAPPVGPGGAPLGPQLGPIVTAYEPPFDTYADMSQLLPAEAWPAPEPLSVAYFCGVMSDDAAPNEPGPAYQAVKAAALGWMIPYLQTFWTSVGSGPDFDWAVLRAPAGATGVERFDAQYWRANIAPSERYVLSLPGTLQDRLAPGDSGWENLFLAGDWTLVPEINAGCVEVAAMSGLQAAAALSGVQIPVATLWPQNSQAGPMVDRVPGR